MIVISIFSFLQDYSLLIEGALFIIIIYIATLLHRTNNKASGHLHLRNLHSSQSRELLNELNMAKEELIQCQAELERTHNHYKRTIEKHPDVAFIIQERDDADRRAGAAERKLEDMEETKRRHKFWLSQTKKEAGYADNISFDIVWADILGKANKYDAICRK
jgi:DNA repair exonuclease SbcCD ATPase subunit